MAFLNQAGNSIFLEINDENKKKLVRPLVRAPVCIWGHAFPSPEILVQAPGEKPTQVRLRDYFFYPCTSTDRQGTGCRFCNATDPAWEFLDKDSQTNKKGHRVDFPKRPQWLLPVWSYADTAIKVIRNGGQVFEEMDNWDTEGRDIRECDWYVWFKQIGQDKKKRTYKSARQDTAKFNLEITEAQIKAAWDEAMKDYARIDDATLDKKVAFLRPEEAKAKFLAANAESTSFDPAKLSQPDASSSPSLPSPFSSPPPPLAAKQPQLPPASDSGTNTNPPAQDPAAELAALRARLAQLEGGQGGGSQSPLASGGSPLAGTAVSTAAPSTSSTPTSPTSSPLAGSGQPSHTSTPSTSSAPAATAPAASEGASSASTLPSNPADYVLESGKYKGKTLKEVIATDPKYLLFFRSTQSEQVKAIITAAIDSKPSMPAPTPTVASAPPPAASAGPSPQPSAPAAASVPAHSNGATNGAAAPTGGAEDRTALVAECKGLIQQIPEFQRKGMGDNMIPFLRAVSGGRFDYTEWPLPDLQKLRVALIERMEKSKAAAAANT